MFKKLVLAAFLCVAFSTISRADLIDGRISVQLFYLGGNETENANVTVTFDPTNWPTEVQFARAGYEDAPFDEVDNCNLTTVAPDPANPNMFRYTLNGPDVAGSKTFSITPGSHPKPCVPIIPFVIDKVVLDDENPVLGIYHYHAVTPNNTNVTITIAIQTVGTGGGTPKAFKAKVGKVQVTKGTTFKHHKHVKYNYNDRKSPDMGS
jgi:hypothetical protein